MNAPVRRFLILLFAAAQYALPAVIGLTDAMSVRGARDVTATHVEEVSSKQCKAPHSADCALCRYLSMAVTKTPSACYPIPRTTRADGTPAVAAAGHAGSRRGFQSRAPPTFLV